MENKQNIKDLVQKFYPYAKNALGFEHPVRVIMRHDAKNAEHSLGKTAYYDPENKLCSVRNKQASQRYFTFFFS